MPEAVLKVLDGDLKTLDLSGEGVDWDYEANTSQPNTEKAK